MAFNLFGKKYFSAGAATDAGKLRKDNQDSFLCRSDSGVFAVSDGMGGGEGGERASRLVVLHLEKSARTPLRDLSRATDFAHDANRAILAEAAEHHLRGMGATVIALLLSPFHPEQALLFHAGDSRCYRLRENTLRQLSADHTIAAAMGVPEEKLARNLRGVLTNAAGCGAGFFVETQKLEIRSGDCYLLCSDGVSRQIPEQEIKRILSSDSAPGEKARMLVETSLEYGGSDNATAVVVVFSTLPEPADDVRLEEEQCPDTPSGEETDDATPPTQ